MAASPTAEPAADAAAAVAATAAMDALHAQGAAQLDPVGWSHIQALARRASAHQGQTRGLLDHKLAGLVAACGERVARARALQLAQATPPARAAGHADTLADLLAHIARHSPAATGGASRQAADTPGAAELKAVRNYRSTWSRLKVDQRMTQLLAHVPEQAGPLNTQRLLHDALTVMRQASPMYLQGLMAQVDVLLWLEQAEGRGAELPKPAHRGAAERRAGGKASSA
jgi:hypothetical protein